MMASAQERLNDAVTDVQAWGAVLDMLQSHMTANAAASEGLIGVAGAPEYRTHLLTVVESRAFDFVLTMACAAAEDLRAAYNAANP